MKVKIVIVSLVLLAVVFLTYHMFSLGKVECSLCIQFKDQKQCSTALGPDEKAAAEEAHRNACAVVAQGVTDSVTCGRTPAEEQSCRVPE